MIRIEHRVDGYVIVRDGLDVFGNIDVTEFKSGHWYYSVPGTCYRWLWLAKRVAKHLAKEEERSRREEFRRRNHINHTVWSSEPKEDDLV